MQKALIRVPASVHTPATIVIPLLADWHRSLELQVASGDISEETATVYRTGLSKLFDWIRARGHVSEDLIREWIGDLRVGGYEPAAISTWFAGARAFFAWAAGQGLLPFDPTSGIKRGRRKGTTRAHRREQLTDREMMRVLEAPPDSSSGRRDRAILALMAYTAARTIEVHRSDLGDLKTEQGRLVLWVRGKGRDTADEMLVIANPACETALRDWLVERGDKPGPLFTSYSRRGFGGRLARSSIRALVKRYFRAAGVRGERKTTHSLRHTAITNAIRHGAPVQKVQAMARHANIATTMIYFHETDRVSHPAEAFVDYEEEQ